MAFLLSCLCAISGILLGAAGLIAGPPLNALMLWLVCGILTLQCGFGIRMIYCIVKTARVGRKHGRGQAVHVEEDHRD